MSIFEFPNPVNENSARLVASGVVVLSAVALATGWLWLYIAVAAGFWLRLLFGPRVSPLALLVTKAVVPRLTVEPRWTPGPPKRFAQGVGVAFSTTAVVLLASGSDTAASVVLAALIVAASLEAFANVCLGCKIFAVLMRVGVVPESVCERCADGAYVQPLG